MSRSVNNAQSRDLEADLRICNNAKKYTLLFALECREGWPHAIRRAIAAEARIEKLENELRMMADQYNGGEQV